MPWVTKREARTRNTRQHPQVCTDGSLDKVRLELWFIKIMIAPGGFEPPLLPPKGSVLSASYNKNWPLDDGASDVKSKRLLYKSSCNCWLIGKV